MASQQLRREDVAEKQEQALHKAELGSSVDSHMGVVTRIATHFESLHDEMAADFPFSPTNQLSVCSSSSTSPLGKSNISNRNNSVVNEEAAEAGKKELAAVSSSSSPTYQKLADAVGRTSQYLSERAKPVIETLAETTQMVKETLTNTIASNTIAADEQETKAANDRATTRSPKCASQNSFNNPSDARELLSSAAVCVKDTTIDTAKKVSTYVGEKAAVAGEKAAVAKDAAVEAGINAVVFSEKVAVDAKDIAVVAGWGVAHYTVEVAGGAAGFIEGKTEGSSAGTVAGYVKEKATAVKDATAEAEELTARKKANAEREAKKITSPNEEPSSTV